MVTVQVARSLGSSDVRHAPRTGEPLRRVGRSSAKRQGLNKNGLACEEAYADELASVVEGSSPALKIGLVVVCVTSLNRWVAVVVLEGEGAWAALAYGKEADSCG